MNTTDWFNHPSVTRKGQRVFVNKQDGVIELGQHDAACHPGSNSKIKLNSMATWVLVNGKWMKSHRTLLTVLKVAIMSKNTDVFIKQLEDL